MSQRGIRRRARHVEILIWLILTIGGVGSFVLFCLFVWGVAQLVPAITDWLRTH